MNLLKTPTYIIAKKEIMDNIRSKWIIALTIIFASLTILVSYAGSLGDRWQDLTLTVSGMMALVQFLVPIIGLMLGYAAIVGEVEKGSMNSLLGMPVTRFEIILGKFLGLGAVLSTTILIGFGLAGIVISINISDVNYATYLIFIGATILIGLIFLNIALLFSSFFKKRTSSMGMAIFSWFFFTIIWSFITGIILIATHTIETLQDPTFIPPDWFFGTNLVNPLSAYSGLVQLNMDAFRGYLPSFYSNGLMILILMTWIIIPLLLSYVLFKRRDV